MCCKKWLLCRWGNERLFAPGFNVGSVRTSFRCRGCLPFQAHTFSGTADLFSTICSFIVTENNPLGEKDKVFFFILRYTALSAFLRSGRLFIPGLFRFRKRNGCFIRDYRIACFFFPYSRSIRSCRPMRFSSLTMLRRSSGLYQKKNCLWRSFSRCVLALNTGSSV